MNLTRIREERTEGFTLIELLVVVIIIGILSSIAIPAYLRQRRGAYQVQLRSDLRNAAARMEQGYHDNGDEYSESSMGGFRATHGVVTVANIDSNGQAYCLRATGEDATLILFYDSDNGGVLSEGENCT